MTGVECLVGFEPTSADANRFAGGPLDPDSGTDTQDVAEAGIEPANLPRMKGTLYRLSYTAKVTPPTRTSAGACGSGDLRRERDSNPRARDGLPAFETGAIVRSATSPCCGSGRIRTSERARRPLPSFQDGAINRTLPRFQVAAERVGFEPTIGSVARLLGSNEVHLSALAPLLAGGGSGGIRTHGPSHDGLRFSRPVHLSALARFLVVAATGIEPMAFRLSDGRSYQLSYAASVVVTGGLEPPRTRRVKPALFQLSYVTRSVR